MIAIDPDRRLYYEGTTFYGHAVWPSPFVSVATVLQSAKDMESIPDRNDLGTARLVFREDAFDPVTRIRRGRFYVRDDGGQPQEWRVQQHPAFDEDYDAYDSQGYFVKRLFGFHVWPARIHLKSTETEALVALGIQDAMTLWRVIGIEQISTGEDLVTLKARSNLGVLPELNEEAVPEGSRKRVMECLEKVADTAYRAGPESVIDRCRDAGAAMLGAWLEMDNTGAVKKDLSELSGLAGGSAKKAIVENASKIIARLHARSKPNEQERHPARPLVEMDAELALECVSVIMREIGWAER